MVNESSSREESHVWLMVKFVKQNMFKTQSTTVIHACMIAIFIKDYTGKHVTASNLSIFVSLTVEWQKSVFAKFNALTLYIYIVTEYMICGLFAVNFDLMPLGGAISQKHATSYPRPQQVL